MKNKAIKGFLAFVLSMILFIGAIFAQIWFECGKTALALSVSAIIVFIYFLTTQPQYTDYDNN